jgi:CheY-like chemotaxis protein
MAHSYKPQSNIVLITDSANDQLLVQRAVDRTGTPFQIRTFFSAAAFAYLEYLRSEPRASEEAACPPPAFVLCDYNLRVMEGSRLVAAIREVPYCIDLTILMYGADLPDSSIAASYAAGANYFVRKPATQERLDVMVQTLYRCATSDPADFEALESLPEYCACPETESV